MNNIFAEYDISNNGFLPNEPLTKLEPYFLEWDNIANNLPKLNAEKKTRHVVNAMPMLDHRKLINVREYQRAYLILSLIVHSYVWCEGPNNAVDTIPKNLAVPFFKISESLGIAPVMTHAGVDLYNWYIVDKSKGFSLDNIRCINTMTGLFDEEWFYLVITSIEYQGGDILKSIINFRNSDNKINELENILISLKNICSTLSRMHEKCSAHNFWYKLRPYLAGWEGNDNLPNGLVYEGISDEPLKFAGGSAAQSSLFPVIDVVFNVEHKDKYFEKIRNYMPHKHRQFIEFARENLRIDTIVKSSDSDDLTHVFNSCLKQLKKFRQIHMAIVHKYIISMARKDKRKEDKKGGMEKGETGTGGTELVPFLKGSIDETGNAKIIMRL